MFPDERLRDTRSHSPALTMGHVDTRPASVQHVAAGHVSAYDTRPASQLSAHTLHAYGSSRSSTSSKHVPRPGHQRNLVIPGAKYSALHTNCRQKQQIALLSLELINKAISRPKQCETLLGGQLYDPHSQF